MIELQPWQWIALSGILLFACFVQSAVGFAAGMISISLSLLIGVRLPECILLGMVASLVQSLGGVWNLRSSAGGQHLWLPIGCRLFWMPIGVFALWQMDQSWDLAQIKQLIGVVILLAIVLLFLNRMPQAESLPWPVTFTAFSLSGFMQGALGMAAPPIVFWLAFLNWSSHKSRVFLFQLFLASFPLQAAVLWYTYTQRFFPAVLTGFALSPLILVGSYLGLRLGNRLDRQRLRSWSMILLTIIAMVSILNPMLETLFLQSAAGDSTH